MKPWEVQPYWHAQSGVQKPRIQALDASPTRLEYTIGLIVGIAIGSALVGWALGHDWEK